MSTLTFTLPLTLSLSLRRRGSRRDRPHARPESDACAGSATLAERDLHEDAFCSRTVSVSRALHVLRGAVQGGWVGEIDLALNLTLAALKDAAVQEVQPQEPLVPGDEPAPAPAG